MGKHFVYRNLRTKTWSLRSSKRIVVGHPTEIWLDDVTLIVSEKVRRRIIQTKRKEVHAGARGNIAPSAELLLPEMIEITYNPYKYESFVRVFDETPISKAKLVFLDSNKKVWALE
jgi:hypothetical protein